MTRKWNGDEITILEEDIIVGLAKKYNKTPAQVNFSKFSRELFTVRVQRTWINGVRGSKCLYSLRAFMLLEQSEVQANRIIHSVQKARTANVEKVPTSGNNELSIENFELSYLIF